jgi:hypothetical protein
VSSVDGVIELYKYKNNISELISIDTVISQDLEKIFRWDWEYMFKNNMPLKSFKYEDSKIKIVLDGHIDNFSIDHK